MKKEKKRRRRKTLFFQVPKYGFSTTKITNLKKKIFFILVLVVFVYILELIYFSRTIPKIISITTVLHIEEEKIKNGLD